MPFVHSYRSLVELGKYNKENGYSLSGFEKILFFLGATQASEREWKEFKKKKNK